MIIGKKIIVLVLFVSVVALSFLLFLPACFPVDYENLCLQELENYRNAIAKETFDKTSKTFYRYITNFDGFDYYCKYTREETDDDDFVYWIKDTYIQKYKDDELIAEFNTQHLPNNVDNNFCIVLKGSVYNNELYFTIRSSESSCIEKCIYKIDLELNSCICYKSESSFGAISPTTLQFYNNNLLYITDKANVVLYDGKSEHLLKQLPLIADKFDSNDFIENDMFDYFGTKSIPLDRSNYQVCYDGKNIFATAGQSIFIFKDGKLKKLPFLKIFKNYFDFVADVSSICDIEVFNTDVDRPSLKISIDWYSKHVIGGKKRSIYLYDVKTGKSQCFEEYGY